MLTTLEAWLLLVTTCELLGDCKVEVACSEELLETELTMVKDSDDVTDPGVGMTVELGCCGMIMLLVI